MSGRADVAGASEPITGAVFADALLGLPKRAFLRAGGLSREAVRRRPIIGICLSWSELNPCNMGLRDLAEAVRRGVIAAGGTALVFPTISLHEQFVAPTTMLLRDLMSMDVEEMIRCSPIDGVVLLAGCDKTVPAQLMGAASAGKPALMLTAGPRSWARFRGAPLVTDDGWKLTSEFLEGRLSIEEVDGLEDIFCASVGVCNVMGTANTMAVMAEVLGMSLPGAAVVPAVHARRSHLAERTGARVVELARSGITPDAILTEVAFDNALRVLVATGGSTNAVIHLEAIAGRLGLRLGLDRVERISNETPLVLGVRPSGTFSMEDFDEAGGVPALLKALAPLLDGGATMGDGRSVAQVAQTAGGRPHPCLRSFNDPFQSDGGLVVLRGSLAPRGSIFKRSAASSEMWTHRGPALVFDDYRTALERSLDPNLHATPDTVLVIRNAGPVGAPGMPEIDVIPIPVSLRQAGVRDMVCVTDGRMSGTQFGAVALHVTPEAATGGPIGLVRDGDEILLDARRGVLDLLVDEREFARRAGESRRGHPTPTRGYEALYIEHVLQADEGCDLDFLVDKTIRPQKTD
ncbi:MAG: dihydroxy-acid dehydratase [Acidimicrobiales bacterium]